MKKLKLILALFAFTLLSGCATMLLLDKDKSLYEKDQGLIFGTWGYEVPSDQSLAEAHRRKISLQIHLEGVINGVNNQYSFFMARPKTRYGEFIDNGIEITRNNEVIIIGAMSLPAGKWTITKYELGFSSYGGVASRVVIENPKEEIFDLAEGEVLYLGNILISAEFYRVLGVYHPSSAGIVARHDNWEEDFSRLVKFRPDAKDLKKKSIFD